MILLFVIYTQNPIQMNCHQRTCIECWTVKPIDSFPIVGGKKNEKARRRRSKCKPCVNLYQKQLRERPNIKNTIRRIHLNKAYGITLNEYDLMLESQDFRCAICRDGELITRGGKIRRLTVDHDHTTGKNRGLLCHSCNVALGYFRESAELLKAAINYLQKHTI